MAKLTPAAGRTLRGRPDIHKRGLRRITKEVWVPITVDGHLLTSPETRIFFALQRMRIRFRAQMVLGGGRTLGGAMVDFWLEDYKTIIEYQGPFHQGSEGEARDFMRMVARARWLGPVNVIYLYERDLDNLYDRISELLGQVAIAPQGR